jgi:hypothetical protein
VIATAIALKKTIHFRILIPPELARLSEAFPKHTPKRRTNQKVLGDVSPVLRYVRWTANSKRQMLQLRDNSAAT